MDVNHYKQVSALLKKRERMSELASLDKSIAYYIRELCG